MQEFRISRLEQDRATIRYGEIEFPVIIEITRSGKYSITFPSNLHIIGVAYMKLINLISKEHKLRFS